MINWTEQNEQLFNTWQSTQQTIWKNWLGMMPWETNQNRKVWQTMLETWQKSVEQTVAAQHDSMNLWLQQVAAVEGTPQQFQELLAQGQTMLTQWQKTQTDMWQGWFSLMSQTEISNMSAPVQETAQEAFKMWQSTMQQMMDAQASWMKPLTGETK